MAFALAKTTVDLVQLVPVFTDTFGVEHSPAEQLTSMVVSWNDVTRSDLTIDKQGNITKGQLQEGDARMAIRGSTLNWPQLAKLQARIKRAEGTLYQIVGSNPAVRGWVSVDLKRMRGGAA